MAVGVIRWRMLDNDDDPNLAWLLELRLKARGNRRSMQLIDRCLVLIARSPPASLAEHEVLRAEVQAIADTLALTYGAPSSCVLN